MLITLLAALALVLVQGLTVHDIWQPILACGALLAVSRYWQPNLLRALAFLVGFSAAFTTLMEAIASTALPLADGCLLATDAVLGLSAPATVATVDQYPALATAFKWAYFSAIPQTCLLLLLLAEKQELWTFLRRFQVAALITVCLFYWLPAEGVATSITPGIAARFHELRAGCALCWSQSQGIITFPSFHTAWAWLLIAAYRRTFMRWPIVALNLVMIASTVTSGGHYFVDVLAGTVVAVITLRASLTS